MGYAKGKNDITGIVWLAMFGSFYKNPDKEKEDEMKTKRRKKVK